MQAIAIQYANEIEQHSGDPEALLLIRERAGTDGALEGHDRDFVLERAGLYLADHDRQTGDGADDEGVEDDDAE